MISMKKQTSQYLSVINKISSLAKKLISHVTNAVIPSLQLCIVLYSATLLVVRW